MDKVTAKLIKLLNSKEPSYVGWGLDFTIKYPDETLTNLTTDTGIINIYDDLDLIIYENLNDIDNVVSSLFKMTDKLDEQLKSNYQKIGSLDPSDVANVTVKIPEKTYCCDDKTITWLLFNNGDTYQVHYFGYEGLPEIGEVQF